MHFSDAPLYAKYKADEGHLYSIRIPRYWTFICIHIEKNICSRKKDMNPNVQKWSAFGPIRNGARYCIPVSFLDIVVKWKR